MTPICIAALSDHALLACTQRSVDDERRVTAELLALLGELDARRLYLGEGCASLFAYCTQKLRLSEHAAYHRIEAARAARQFPIILNLLADGAVTLTSVAMLRPHLTDQNYQALLAEAQHKTKREVEQQIARLAPKPDTRSIVRRLPVEAAPVPALPASDDRCPAPSEVTPPTSGPVYGPRPIVATLSTDRFLLRVTLSAAAHDQLRRAQDLLSHTVPNRDPAIVIEKALALLVDSLERAKTARVSKPRSAVRTRPPAPGGWTGATTARSRHIPAAVRRAVWDRDEGRCAFVGRTGRCVETGYLEFHHLTPFALGGPADVANIALRCHAHNRFEGEQVFGPALMRTRAGHDRAGGL
jgi:hypothetical protein